MAATKEALRDLIHMLKYQQVRPAANVLGRMLAEVVAGLEPSFLEAKILVIPVPLHRSKLRQRGFNQAEMIARTALKLSGSRDRYLLCLNGFEASAGDPVSDRTDPAPAAREHARRLPGKAS